MDYFNAIMPAINRLSLMLQGILMFLGILHCLQSLGVYDPSISLNPAMAAAIAAEVNDLYADQVGKPKPKK